MRPSAPEAAIASWTAAAEPRSVAALREHARAFVVEHGADDDVVQRVLLAVSEAAANAVLHAYVGLPPGTVELTCHAGLGEVRVTVTDEGRGMQPRSDSPGMGLGLSTMGRLAERLDVRTGPGGRGTSLALTFRAPGVRGAALLPRGDPGAELLVAASDLARSAAWPQEGFERLCDLVLGDVADAAAVDIVEHGTLRRLAARVHGDRRLSAWLASSTPPAKPGTATWDALHHGETRLVVHDPATRRSPTGPGETLDLAWWLAVPMADGDDVLAVLGMGGRADRPPPGEAAVALVAEAAKRAAAGLANANVLAAMQTTRDRLEAVLEDVEDSVSVTDADGRVLYANQVTADLLGVGDLAELEAADPLAWFDRFAFADERGRPVPRDAFPSRRLLRGEPAAPALLRAVERRTGRTRWLDVRGRLLDDPEGPLVVNVSRDVTAAVAAEHRRRAAAAVGAALDRPGAEAALQQAAEAVVPDVADACAIDLLDDDGGLRRAALAHPDPGQLARLRALHERWPPASDPAMRAVLAGDRPRVVANVTDAYLRALADDDDQLALLLELGLRSVVVTPLRAAGRTTGLLTLTHDRSSGRTFAEADVAFAGVLGRVVGSALAAGR